MSVRARGSTCRPFGVLPGRRREVCGLSVVVFIFKRYRLGIPAAGAASRNSRLMLAHPGAIYHPIDCRAVHVRIWRARGKAALSSGCKFPPGKPAAAGSNRSIIVRPIERLPSFNTGLSTLLTEQKDHAPSKNKHRINSSDATVRPVRNILSPSKSTVIRLRLLPPTLRRPGDHLFQFSLGSRWTALAGLRTLIHAGQLS